MLRVIQTVVGYRAGIKAEAEWIRKCSLVLHDSLLNTSGKVDFFPLHRLVAAYGEMLTRERQKRNRLEYEKRGERSRLRGY